MQRLHRTRSSGHCGGRMARRGTTLKRLAMDIRMRWLLLLMHMLGLSRASLGLRLMRLRIEGLSSLRSRMQGGVLGVLLRYLLRSLRMSQRRHCLGTGELLLWLLLLLVLQLHEIMHDLLELRMTLELL